MRPVSTQARFDALLAEAEIQRARRDSSADRLERERQRMVAYVDLHNAGRELEKETRTHA